MNMIDQAEALRQLMRQHSSEGERKKTRVVTVTSGKGGVGKSNFSLNFALSLKRLGLDVLLFDADIGMANIDVLMGRSFPYHLYHLISGEKTIWDIIAKGPEGLHYIAGGSGLTALMDLTKEQIVQFTKEIERLHGKYDVIIFDTGAGLSKETAAFIAASDDTIVVTTPEPTAITDAYALIKMVIAMNIKASFKLVINKAADHKEGQHTLGTIQLTAEKFLQIDLPELGIILDDPNVSKAVKKQTPFLVMYPATAASKSVTDIAATFMEVKPALQSGGIKGFFNKIFRLS